MKFGIIQFLGSNCDDDCVYAVKNVLGEEAVKLWHASEDLQGSDCLVLPGGFSYGDYLRTGSMAARSPIMKSVADFSRKGGPVLGICNGFQILCEAGLLPGTLMQNKNLQFICDNVSLIVERSDTVFTNKYQPDEKITLPIAHMDGHYYIDDAGLKELERNRQIIFRYVENPNGSVADIAGIVNKEGNVMGLMPHPERAVEALLGGTDGLKLWKSLL